MLLFYIQRRIPVEVHSYIGSDLALNFKINLLMGVNESVWIFWVACWFKGQIVQSQTRAVLMQQSQVQFGSNWTYSVTC